MNWIKQNTILATIAAVALVLVGVLGWFTFSGYSKANKAQEKYDKAASSLSRLYGGKIYPNEKNLKEHAALAQEIQDTTVSLHKEMAKRFTPSEKTADAATFGQRVQSRYQSLRQAWEARGMEVPENFFLGFPTYRESVAAPENAVSHLDYQLDAIAEVLEIATTDDILSIDQFKRAHVTNEAGESAGAEVPVVVEDDGFGDDPYAEEEEEAPPLPLDRYTITMNCTGSQDAIRNFINDLAASESHLYAFRAIRLQNEVPKGPNKEEVRKEVKSASPAGGGDGGGADSIFGGGFADFAPAAPAAPAESLSDAEKLLLGAGAATPGGNAAAGKPAAAEPEFAKPGTKDSYQFLGAENIKAHLEFDLVVIHPMPKSEGAAPDEAPEESDQATN
jgi:hypothetical protein